MIRSISHVLAAVFSNASEFNRHWSRDDSERPHRHGLAAPLGRPVISETNGHHGALRCLLTQNSPTEYAATFYAVYGGVLRVCYTVPLRGQRDGETLKLEGDAGPRPSRGGNRIIMPARQHDQRVPLHLRMQVRPRHV